ncbi:hypothetical protein BHE74_00019917 [Ensete ventricosum]|nr:hypothetical protein BHE74_00019917 [Ensete ventricosum]
MRRSLGNLIEVSSFPRHFKREGDKEKTATKKSPPRDVHIRGIVPRFSGHRRLPLSLSSSLLLLPFSHRNQDNTAQNNLISSDMGLRQGYCPIASGPRTDLLADQYVPPVSSSKI